ncbi:MAG: GntP family permease [Muribaculaceae bacterium]|nr:GntP family permease [Muribaculaceae bacterium]MDE7343065.1 GntP family permease [Muribaculaceae bacterium]
MSAIGVLIGLALAIFLIIKKVPIAYCLILGAVVGGLCGGVSLVDTIEQMFAGVKDIIPAILRILTAGVLTGILIQTGAAETISAAIIKRLGRNNIFLALALSTMLLTAVGVFIDVAVITVAPIAISLHKRYKIPASKLLLMMIGGGKCGNIISPNPNTIVSAENFQAPLSSVMAVNVIAAVVGLIFTVTVIKWIYSGSKDEAMVIDTEAVDPEIDNRNLPSLFSSIAGPVVAILLLALRPICGVVIDPLIALPAGGLVGLVLMRRSREALKCVSLGLSKMTGVAILLIGTGTIAGVIKASSITGMIVGMLSSSHFGETLMAPLSGILMSAATASTTAGATIASSSFAPSIMATGVSAVWGAAMINSGATVLDHLPHGTFFHATGGTMSLTFRRCMALVPYETAIGLVLAIMTFVCYELSRFF